MASLPLMMNLIDELSRDAYDPLLYGNDFGLGLHPHHIHHRGHRYREPSAPAMLGYTLPLAVLNRDRQLSRRNENKETRMSAIGKDGFQVCMDVGQFKPSELTVKVVDDCVVVEGRHEEREDDHGYISRHFVRRYSLPKGYDPEKVVSTLSSDGVLTVCIPKPAIEEKANERIIQIQQTGPAHLNVKANSQEKIGDSSANNADQ